MTDRMRWIIANSRKFIRLLTRDPDLAFCLVRALFSGGGRRGTVLGKVNSRIRFEFNFSLDPVIRWMYFGAYEVWTQCALRRLLHKGDVFLDVGANIGYISAYAASLVGRGGQVHSFEPVPEYFARLAQLLQLNPDYDFHLNSFALGERNENAVLSVSSLPNIGWNTMVDGFMEEATVRKKLTIRVLRLDEYLLSKNLGRVTVIKIDTEGFELPVLKGLSGFLEKIPLGSRPALIIEVAPHAYPFLHSNLAELEGFLQHYGYSVRLLEDPERMIDVKRFVSTTNILCCQN
jgi:FkbM family methyltransferase